MYKLKRAAAVAVMVGGIGLAGGGVAHAGDGPYPDVAIENLQAVKCDQAFDGGGATLPGITGDGSSIGGDVEQNTGNFCAVIGSIED